MKRQMSLLSMAAFVAVASATTVCDGVVAKNGIPPERQELIPLPFGSITARGWIRTMLERSRDGMGGHFGEFGILGLFFGKFGEEYPWRRQDDLWCWGLWPQWGRCPSPGRR